MEETVQHRAEDPPVKIIRQIPLTWLFSLLAVVAGQAIALYYGQQENAKLVATLVARVETLTEAINAKNLKDVEHDLNISDLQRRMLQIETRRKE